MYQPKSAFSRDFYALCRRLADAARFCTNLTETDMLRAVKEIQDTGKQFRIFIQNPENLELKEVIIKYDSPEPLYANLWRFGQLKGLHTYQQDCRLHLDKLPHSLEALTLTVQTSLHFLKRLPELRSLNLCYKAQSLETLPCCPGLISFEYLGGLLAEDARKMPNIRNLKACTISDDITNKVLPNLERLSIDTYSHNSLCKITSFPEKRLSLNLPVCESLFSNDRHSVFVSPSSAGSLSAGLSGGVRGKIMRAAALSGVYVPETSV